MPDADCQRSGYSSFLDDAHCVTLLFAINRVVDLLFLCDMVIIFNSAYAEGTTGRWVYSRRQIAANYLTSWFLVECAPPAATTGRAADAAAASASGGPPTATPGSLAGR